MGSLKMANIMVVFDFDKTIVDCDTDNWVLGELGYEDLFYKLLPTMPWNSAMDHMLKEMHEKGVKIEDMVEVLKKTPMHARIIPAIKSAYDAGCDLRILSDANKFFIETILNHHELGDYFTEIHTNSGFVDEEGRLRIIPHHDFTTTPHGCDNILCPPNMCKGQVMEKLLCNEKNKTFIYLGDGNGDHCPSIKLRDGDHCMPRKNFPLWDVILSKPNLISAKIHEWTDGEDLETVLQSLINMISLNKEKDDHVLQSLARVDCKIETNLPVSNCEALPQALSVLN
ncbi:inorganic pyrophosphatase 2-like [Silene latifolia]|uniref:inorganic pyrophosphatase 2-like n=1 Tax=Silene latifolia TaxID=37657 RepID=UPI003D774E5F